jgi:asparagine synthase (glutamine-hydrolysing)
VCGIVGAVDWEGAERWREGVVRARDAMMHRGPDGAGLHVEGPVALGHRRLSIIDLGGGHQPMTNEDGTVVVTFNGEIYNYKELAAALRERHTLRTSSDTEVLVHLYEDKGTAMLADLRGMFAFALWDARRQRLFAARDRYGEKPLYWAPIDPHDERRGIAFASELGALAATSVDLGGIDRAALDDYLRLLYVPAPRTIRANARKLPAGHGLVCDRSGTRVFRYHEPPLPGSAGDRTPESAARELRPVLEQAVRLQLRSDVPIAALLSGGIDSSTVVALMARELGPGVKTFSVGFGSATDELPMARLVADRYRTDHHELKIDLDLSTQAERAIRAYGEPFGDSSAVPTVAVFSAVAPHARVVLTGDGGDELFGGYDRYREVQRWPRVPGVGLATQVVDRLERRISDRRLSRVRRGLELLGPNESKVRAYVEIFGRGARRALLGETGARSYVPRSFDAANAAIETDLAVYLPDDLLVKTDVAAMAASVESRCPLLDPEIARTAIGWSIEAKLGRREGKLALRGAVPDLVPREILTRPKTGFGSPVERWLSGPLRDWMLDLLTSSGARLRDHVDGARAARVAHEVARGAGNAHQAWALLALEVWLRAQRA